MKKGLNKLPSILSRVSRKETSNVKGHQTRGDRKTNSSSREEMLQFDGRIFFLLLPITIFSYFKLNSLKTPQIVYLYQDSVR